MNRGGMLRTVYDKESEIILFLKMKGKHYPELCDHDCVCAFVCCTDITQYMNDLNVILQGANHFIIEMFDNITAFMRKFRFWELQLRSNNVTHFSILRKLSSLRIRNVQNKFSFFFSSSTPVFKIYASMRPPSTYFQSHLTLMFKVFS